MLFCAPRVLPSMLRPLPIFTNPICHILTVLNLQTQTKNESADAMRVKWLLGPLQRRLAEHDMECHCSKGAKETLIYLTVFRKSQSSPGVFKHCKHMLNLDWDTGRKHTISGHVIEFVSVNDRRPTWRLAKTSILRTNGPR